jgi:hypothetical protein
MNLPGLAEIESDGLQIALRVLEDDPSQVVQQRRSRIIAANGQ